MLPKAYFICGSTLLQKKNPAILVYLLMPTQLGPEKGHRIIKKTPNPSLYAV